MSDSPHDHDRPDGEPEDEQPEPEDEPARHRPGIAEQLAVMRTYCAVLSGHDDEAHQAAGTGRCDACTVIAAASYGIMLAEELAEKLVRKLAPGAEFDARPIRAQLLVMIAETERELRAAGN